MGGDMEAESGIKSDWAGCVYLIRFAASEYVYVGSTLRARNRRTAHLYQLRSGVHHSIHLQRAFDKHGEEALLFEIVESVPDVLFLRAREQFWMWRHEGRLYNRCPDAFSPLGLKMPEEMCRKTSARMMGNSLRRGATMSPEWIEENRARVIGNSYRTGIPHPEEDRKKIGDGLRRAFAEGRRQGAPAFDRYRRQVAAGEIPSPSVKQERNDRWVKLREFGWSFSEIARSEQLDPSGVRKTILGHIKRMGSQK